MKSDFTYEAGAANKKLETYEWDNVWWEQAPDKDRKRVLYIGDSISCGVRRFATEAADNRILFDGFGSSKALDNPYFKESVSIFGKQQGHREAVIFNNGLHGWHLADAEYEKLYEDFIIFLKKEFYGTPVAVVLTTDIKDTTERRSAVRKRNEIAEKIAQKYTLPVIDLFSVSCDNADYHTADGVHFDENGYRKLAQKIVKCSESIISEK